MDSEEVRRQWAERSGAYSPAYYAHYGPDQRSEAVRRSLERFVDRDASVLELGCSSGRHLAHLYEHGFENPAGIDVNGDAFDVMEATYPELAASGTFYHGSIEAVVADLEDDRFDAVFSVETLQHLHPDSEWVLEELTRISADVVVTVENEGSSGETEGAAAETPPADGSGAGEGSETDGEPGDAERDDVSDRPRSSEPAVNYVTNDLPLYYRDWNRVFTELGLVQVDVRSGDRDTVRTFRSSRQ